MAVKFRDYYEVLGVGKTATEDEIRKALAGVAVILDLLDKVRTLQRNNEMLRNRD